MGYPPDLVWMVGGYPGYPPQPGLDGVPPPNQVWMVGGTWGTPSPGLDGGGGVPGVPPPTRSGWGTPPPDQVWIRQNSIASTCYAAGGVPLAFTQEDFLVHTD